MINPASFLEPATVTLQDLMSGKFQVPDYQRDYSWRQEQVVALWEDLVSTASDAFTGAGLPVASPMPHFMGPVVLQSFPSQPTRPFEVMDGQQRLVTLTALLSVLREYVDDFVDPAERMAWGNTLAGLLGTWEIGQYSPRVTLARDNDHYRELVCLLNNRADRQHYYNAIPAVLRTAVLERLHTTLETLNDKVDAFLSDLPPGSAREARLLQLIRTLLELAVFLQMKVLEQGVAYEVFEGLNARGLELQQADLLKNRLYQLAEQQHCRPAVKAAWEKLVVQVESQSWISLTEFLHFHYLVTVGPAKQATLYRTVNQHLSKPVVGAEGYADSIAIVAERLFSLLDAGAQLSPAAARDVSAIRDSLSNKFALLPIMAACVRHPFPSPELESACRLAHRFAFRRFVVEEQTLGKYSAEVEKLARDYAAGVLSDLAALASAMKSLSIDAVFQDRFARFRVRTNKLGFYVLEHIENHISANAGIYVHPQSPSQHLEHIMPKRPGQLWPHVSGDPAYEEYVSRLGNLLVLEADINQTIKNKDYGWKTQNPTGKDYTHSHLSEPHTLTSYESAMGEWNFDSIDTRQDSMAASYALTVWGLDG